MYTKDIKAIKKALELWKEGNEYSHTVADYIYCLRDNDYTFSELETFVNENTNVLQMLNNSIIPILSKPFKKRAKARIYTSLTIVIDNKTFILEVDENSFQSLKNAIDKDFKNTKISLRELIFAYVSRSISER